MNATLQIPVHRISTSRLPTVDNTDLGFGKYISDHMVVGVYHHGKWHTPEVVPYGELKMSPALLALHYGQSVFEGMKAYRMQDGNISIFRTKRHAARLNKSLERMCMPIIDEDYFIQSLHTLIETDAAWVPAGEGASLYIRPVVFASEAKLGVKISDQYTFVIMTSPVGPYYNKPLKVKVEETYVRAAEGGTGFAKCAGNYGGAFYPTQVAREQGYDQVLWTDAKDHQYIDEAGTMNVMFVINGKLVTPQLSSALLDGVTRDSILTLAKEMNMPIEQRKVHVDELAESLQSGKLTEAFGAGTAAVVSPIALINIHGKDYALPEATDQSFQQRAKQKLNNIRLGLEPDLYGWNDIIKIK